MIQKLTALVLGLIFWLPFTAAADSITDPMSDPFGYFQVYSLGNIGSATQSYGSSIDGVVGAGGDAYFSGISIYGQDSDTGYLLHTGGSTTLSGGSYYNGLYVGKDLTVGSMDIHGDVSVGGDLLPGGGGDIYGDASAQGEINLQDYVVHGQEESGSSYDSMVDHLALSLFFKSTSEMIGAYDSTGMVEDLWGTLTFTGTKGINVVSIDAETLRSADTFNIEAPEDAVVYINVITDDDNTVTLDWTGWTYLGGISPGNVLLNMPTIETLHLSNGNAVNILAPFANTDFYNGTNTGSLVVGNLTGSGSMSLGHFEAGGSAAASPTPVPEPGTMVLMLAGLVAILAARKIPRTRRRALRLWKPSAQVIGLS